MKVYQCAALVLATLLALSDSAKAVDPEAFPGTKLIGVGVPTSTSPDVNTNTYNLKIWYIDPAGKKQSTKVVAVPGIAVTAGFPTPTAAQAAAASAAKAQAIVNAINKAAIAIQPVTIDSVTYKTVTAAVNPKTQPGMYYTGTTAGFPPKPVLAPFNQTTIAVSGVTQEVIFPSTPSAKLGSAIRQMGNNTTGEMGNGKFAFNVGSPGSAGLNSGAMYEGTLVGTGAAKGLSTGLDGSGDPSIVGFGFIDYSSPSTPANFITAFLPVSGMTDYDIMTTLESLFEEDFASLGYTATYDPINDVLSIDQLLPSTSMLWSANSDTGLLLNLSANTVPEPSSFGLLATGILGFSLLYLCKRT